MSATRARTSGGQAPDTQWTRLERRRPACNKYDERMVAAHRRLPGYERICVRCGRGAHAPANFKTAKGGRCRLRFKNGDPTRTRTWDPMVKSHLLYRLSYRTEL